MPWEEKQDYAAIIQIFYVFRRLKIKGLQLKIIYKKMKPFFSLKGRGEEIRHENWGKRREKRVKNKRE